MNVLSLIAVILSFCVLFQGTTVDSCPTNCKCRGKATKCGTGFSSSSMNGLDPTTEYLGISGSDSIQNNISTVQKSDFQSVQSLFSLDITFSNVRLVEDGAFSLLTNLRILNLANNDIQNLSANSFKGLTRLVSLDLSGNKNCGISKAVFTYIGTVEELNLGNMNIKILENGLFDNVPKLKKLRLYLNALTKIPTNTFSLLTSLEFLDISANNLSTLQSELEPLFSKLKQLNLAENPWQCSCQLLWIRGLPHSLTQSVTDKKDIICYGPDNLKYSSLNSIPGRMLHCMPIKIRNCENISYSIEEQEFILLPCAFDGYPPPEIKWTRPDGHEIIGRGNVEGNYEIFGNGTLSIHHVTGNDNGDWIVSAYNKTAHVDKRININVIPLSTSFQPTSKRSKPTSHQPTLTRRSVTARWSTSTPVRPKSGSSSLHVQVITIMTFAFLWAIFLSSYNYL